MPLLLDAAPLAAAVALRRSESIRIGLVNNMPDAALEATERQFVGLLRAAAGDRLVELKLFAMAEVPRVAAGRAQLAGRYRDVAELMDTSLDGLIVTGTEPRAQDLKQEPYWATLAQLVDWARENTGSAVWSCLAAHAAVLHADGIARRPLPQKTFGVFDCELVGAHPFTKDAPPQLRVPHSRHNDLPAPALSSCGYRVLSRSAAAGVDMFVREEARGSFFLFLQGHPEYENDTLLREYRRDVGRYLRGEREFYPPTPQGYFTAEAAQRAEAFRARALRERADSLAADFPMTALAIGLQDSAVTGGEAVSPWRATAVGLYRRWLTLLKERKMDRCAGSARDKAWPDRLARRARPAAG